MGGPCGNTRHPETTTYNLILIAVVVISVLIGTSLGKGGPEWKAPLISVCIFVIAMILLSFLGVNEGTGN